VIELVRRKTPVRDEDLGADAGEERPDRDDLERDRFSDASLDG
jgi:hypothetical protein